MGRRTLLCFASNVSRMRTSFCLLGSWVKKLAIIARDLHLFPVWRASEALVMTSVWSLTMITTESFLTKRPSAMVTVVLRARATSNGLYDAASHPSSIEDFTSLLQPKLKIPKTAVKT